MSTPSGLILIDAAVFLHPLMDGDLLLEELNAGNQDGIAAISALSGSREVDARLRIGARRYPQTGSSLERTKRVLSGLQHRELDVIILCAPWAHSSWAQEGWSKATGVHVEIFRFLDPVPERKLAHGLLGAALHAQEVLW